jgi:hypothetical protein
MKPAAEAAHREAPHKGSRRRTLVTLLLRCCAAAAALCRHLARPPGGAPRLARHVGDVVKFKFKFKFNFLLRKITQADVNQSVSVNDGNLLDEIKRTGGNGVMLNWFSNLESNSTSTR